MYMICKDFPAIWIIVSVVLKSQEKAENHEEDCGIETFCIFLLKSCVDELLFFVSHSPLGAITLFMLLLRTWQVLCKNILPSCLKEKLWDTSSALLFQYCFTCLQSDRGLPEGMCRTSPDTKRITEAAHYMPRWWRHHHIAMQRERWIPGPQALSCFKKF